jgi:signal transduction histidine kinase
VRATALALVVTGLVLGVVAEWSSLLPESAGLAAADFAVGFAFIGLGGLTLRGAPAPGAFMAATGLAWFLGGVAGALVFLHRGPLVHLLLSYPGGRLETRLERVVVVAAYVCAAVYPLGRSNVATLVLIAAVVGTTVARYARSGGAERRARACALVAAAGLGTVLAAAAVARLAGADADSELLWAYEVALALTALGLYAALRWGGWTQAAVTGVVVDLGDLGREATLRARLARSVGDPSLELGFWDRSQRGYADEEGRMVELEPQPPGRALLLVADDAGRPAAAIVHDAAVLSDARLADAVSAAVRIAVANVELQARVLARVEELRASRRRLVEAAVSERRRLERELRAAAEPRLRRVAELLEAGGPELGALREELDAVEAELVELARGIHPRALTETGLGAALEELAGRFPLPVEVDARDVALPAAVAAAAYFVCSEGLANAVKHAEASQVRLAVRPAGEYLLVEVADDGVGGADLVRGSGLRGIADRVEALGGELDLDSPPGAGTRLATRIPVVRAPGVRQPIPAGSVA